MLEVTKESRVEQLEALLEILAAAIDEAPGARDLAQLSKQYRETLLDIENIKGVKDQDDEISEILSNRIADGKSSAVRKGSTKL